MRIIGHIPHPAIKITVFKMDNRLSVKFETGHFEQTYKFREQEGLQYFQDVERLVDESLMNMVIRQFQDMQSVREACLDKIPMEADSPGLPEDIL
ncbi:MAG: hypothetical protein RLY31_983 [Bacteroidota bacterium]|jgi:hypothetical protein